MQEIDTAFDYIPDETNTSVIYSKDTTPISVGVKPVKFCEDYTEEKFVVATNSLSFGKIMPAEFKIFTVVK